MTSLSVAERIQFCKLSKCFHAFGFDTNCKFFKLKYKVLFLLLIRLNQTTLFRLSKNIIKLN